MNQDGSTIEAYRQLYALYLDGELLTRTKEVVDRLLEGSRRKGLPADNLVPVFYGTTGGRRIGTFFSDVERCLASDESQQALVVLAWRIMGAKDNETQHSDREGPVVFAAMAHVARTAERAAETLTAEGRGSDANAVKEFLSRLRSYKDERRRDIDQRLTGRRP